MIEEREVETRGALKMKIVNLTQSRERYPDIELIKVESESVFFSVQVNEGKRYFYEVRRYETENKRSELLWRYELGEDIFYTQKVYMDGNKIIIAKLQDKGQVGIEVLDKTTGKFIKAENIWIGDIQGEEIIAINQRYFLVGGENKKAENMYYLCDIEEQTSYLVTMLRLVGGLPAGHGLIRRLPCFKRQGEEWVIFNESYMEDYEYEQIYDCIMAKNFDASQIRETEGLYVLPLTTLIEGIKQREDIIPFREIKKRWIDGWIRYLGIKNGNIYYREKDFETQIENVYAVDIESLEERIVCQINHQQLNGVLRYDLEQIYEDIRGEEKRYVRGHYGLDKTLEIPMHKRLRFEAYLEYRYIVTSWWWENEVDGVYEYKEFVGIQDTQGEGIEKQMLVYEGQCYVEGTNVVIY